MSKRSLYDFISKYDYCEGELAERISDCEEDHDNSTASKKAKTSNELLSTTESSQQNINYTSEMLKFTNANDDQHHNNNGSTSSSNNTERINGNNRYKRPLSPSIFGPEDRDHDWHTPFVSVEHTFAYNNQDDFDEQYARALQNSLNDGGSVMCTNYDLNSDVPRAFQAEVHQPTITLEEFSAQLASQITPSSSHTMRDDYPTGLSTKLYPEGYSTLLWDPKSETKNSNDYSSSCFGDEEHEKKKNNFKNNSNKKNNLHAAKETRREEEQRPLTEQQQDLTNSRDSNSTDWLDRSNSTPIVNDSRKQKRSISIEEEDIVDLSDQSSNNNITAFDQQQVQQKTSSENNLLNTMPIQSATEGSESSDRPTLTSQNSKRLQQVPGVNSAPTTTSEPTSPTNTGNSVASVAEQNTSSHVNTKTTRLFSEEIAFRHLICINPKNVGEVSSYQIALTFDENSSYTSKTEPPSKQCLFKVGAKYDLKRLIELISDHSTMPITTVCFKKTLGERQKIIPLSTKLSIFEKITLQKPVTLFINGNEFVELDYGHMYTEAGNDLFREKKFEEARECYNTATKRYPNDSRVLSNRALCLIKLGNFYQAFNDLSTVIADKNESTLLDKVLHRRAHAASELVKNLTPNDEMTNFINSLVANTIVKDESLEVKLHYLCLKDMQSYFQKVGILGDYATVIRKKEVELNDVKLIRSFHYLLHNAPKVLNYCLITKRELTDLKQTTVFPSSIYSPENKDSSLIHTPMPFCSREWYDSEMARYEELFSVKLWKPFYDNNENIHGKQMSSQELYKFIIFTTFKYLLSKPDFGTLLSSDINFKIFTKILIYLAFSAGTPPKVYLYINNKSDETKISMREYIHQNVIEYVHIQVRDFHFIVEFKQPASSSFSATDSSYGAKENRVKHGSENFSIRVGDNLPSEILE